MFRVSSFLFDNGKYPLLDTEFNENNHLKMGNYSAANFNIVLSLHNDLLKRQIEKYAKKRGLSISGMVENYFQNIIKIEGKEDVSSYRLPAEFTALHNL